MTISEVLNLIAIIVIPIVAVLIGQWLQDRAEKRKDKMEIFKSLMIARNGWSPESVRSLNIIDIVFAEDKSVRSAWKEYYDKLCVENATETDLKKIKYCQDKLLEAMAVSLGYKDKITWETIQNPYKPKGMVEAELMQQEYQNGQLEWAKTIGMFRNLIESNPNNTGKVFMSSNPEEKKKIPNES